MKKKILLLHNISSNIKIIKTQNPLKIYPYKKRKMQLNITVRGIIKINNSESFNNEELKKELFYNSSHNYSNSYGQSSGGGFCK